MAVAGIARLLFVFEGFKMLAAVTAWGGGGLLTCNCACSGTSACRCGGSVPNNELGVLMIVNRKSVVWRSQKRLHDAVSHNTGFEPRFSKFDFPPFFQVLGGMIQIQEIHTDGHVNHQSVMMRVRARKKF